MTASPALPALDFDRIGPAVGTRFPDVRLPDQTGRLVDLHAARAGRCALVVFYRSARWWPFCKVQLVELQAVWPELERAGIALFVISYDAVPTLAAFAKQRGITFPLLSDEGSHTIRALGLLNAHLAEQHAVYGLAVREDQQGVAYPGTFVLDEQGAIVEKHFEQSYRVRPSAALAREYALGPSQGVPAEAVRGGGEDIQVRAWTDAPAYRPYQQLRLHVQLNLAPGVHVYEQPIPDGYVPLRLEVEALEGLTVEAPAFDPGSAPYSFRIEGLDEEFVAYTDRVRATIPLLFTRNLGATRVGLRVEYQACTDSTCFPPGLVRLEVPLEGLELIRD